MTLSLDVSGALMCRGSRQKTFRWDAVNLLVTSLLYNEFNRGLWILKHLWCYKVFICSSFVTRLNLDAQASPNNNCLKMAFILLVGKRSSTLSTICHGCLMHETCFFLLREGMTEDVKTKELSLNIDSKLLVNNIRQATRTCLEETVPPETTKGLVYTNRRD